MKKMNEKPGHVRPENGFYEKLNALKFVPQQELSREQANRRLPKNATYFEYGCSPPSSNCLCEDLRSACDREHTKVLELEAEVLKQQKMVIESEKHTSSASNAIFEINKLRQQLQGKDDTIRNLDAQINIMKVLNVGSTEVDLQALENPKYLLHEIVYSTVQKHPRTSNRPTQKPQVQQNMKPKVPVNLSTRTKPATESRKPMPKSHTRNHRILPSTECERDEAADPNRKLNVVDHNQFVVRSLKSVNTKTPHAKHSVNHTKKVWKATRNHIMLSLSGNPLDDICVVKRTYLLLNSIAERLTRPTAYKFKTGCSIIPVWGEGSTVPVESHHTPTGAPSTSQPHLSPTLRSSIRQETEVPQPSSPPHTNVADEAASTGVDVRYGGAATTVTGLEAGQGSGNIDKTPTMPHDSPLPRVHTLGSDEGRMQHNELMDLVTKLSDRVVALETDLTQTKKVYGAAFTKLIKKVKRLEKKDKLSKSRRKLRLVLSDEEGSDSDILAQEDPSKQGRKIAQIDEDEGITLVQMGVSTASTDFTTANVPVTTAGAEISTASPEVKTAGDSVDDIAAESLVYIRRSAAKTKDKGKGIMEESKSAMTKTKRQQEQERLGYEAALRLQEQLNEEERQRIAKAHKVASSFNIEEWEDIRVRIEADEELAQRLQAEEREKYSEVKKVRLLAELINQRKRHFAQQRAEERRNKPPTQA
ncbi:hypothetical protein Tco_0221192 [Tanacetum coccineum]